MSGELFHRFDELRKCFWMFHGHLRKHLAINGDVFRSKSVDKCGVLCLVQAQGVVETDNPQASHGALLGATVAALVDAGLDNSLFGGCIM